MNPSFLRIHIVQPSTLSADVSDRLPEANPFACLDRAALHGLIRHIHTEERLRAGDGEVFLLQSTYKKIMTHLSSDIGRELGGLLVGTEIPWNEGRPSILIQDALPALHTSSNETRLTFTEASWAEFDRELDAREARGEKLQRVGWYHSHPRMGIFLSRWDLDVCQEFRRPTQVALVVDPVEPKGGFFVQGPEGFREYAPQGFWEMKDLTPDSIVCWKSVTALPELPSSFLQGWLVSSAAPPEVPMRPQEITPPTQSENPSGATTATPLLGPPSPPPSEPPRHRWLLAAAVLAATLLGSIAGWGFGRRAWGEASEAVLQRHAEDLKVLHDDVKSLNVTLAALVREEQLKQPAAPAPVPAPTAPEPAPPPPVPKPKPPKPVVDRFSEKSAENTIAPSPTPQKPAEVPIPESVAVEPSPTPETQNASESSPQPAIEEGNSAEVASDPPPAPVSTATPPPASEIEDPPSPHQGETGSHQKPRQET